MSLTPMSEFYYARERLKSFMVDYVTVEQGGVKATELITEGTRFYYESLNTSEKVDIIELIDELVKRDQIN